MPNKIWNPMHKEMPADTSTGARGKGKEQTTKNTYGDKQNFGTEWTTDGDKIQSLGGKGKFKNC